MIEKNVQPNIPSNFNPKLPVYLVWRKNKYSRPKFNVKRFNGNSNSAPTQDLVIRISKFSEVRQTFPREFFQILMIFVWVGLSFSIPFFWTYTRFHTIPGGLMFGFFGIVVGLIVLALVSQTLVFSEFVTEYNGNKLILREKGEHRKQYYIHDYQGNLMYRYNLPGDLGSNSLTQAEYIDLSQHVTILDVNGVSIPSGLQMSMDNQFRIANLTMNKQLILSIATTRSMNNLTSLLLQFGDQRQLELKAMFLIPLIYYLWTYPQPEGGGG